MKKRFDFFGSPKTSYFKKLRLHSKFPIWKMEVGLFAGLLFTIFFAFTIYASFNSLKQEFSFQFNVNQIQEQNIEESIQSLSAELIPYLEKIQTTLPADQYSFGRSEVENLENLILNLDILVGQIPYAQKGIETLVSTGSAKDLLAFLKYNEQALVETVSQLDVLVYSLNSVPFLPESLKQKLDQLQQVLPHFQTLSADIKTLYEFFGDEEPHRIVIWLQNAYEKRNTGGFIGSFFEVVLNDGEVSVFQMNDIYEYDGQLLGTDEVPALAQRLVGDKTWSLRDANYSPLFSDSAQAFNYFYEQAGGDTIDTIIAIDNTMIERVLDMIGGIEIPEYNLQLTSKNFSFVLSFLVEGKFDAQSPKSFIAEQVIPRFVKKLKGFANLDFTRQFYRQEQENIQLFSRNDDIATMARIYGLGKDFFEVISDSKNILVSQISISGNKSDAYVKQDFELKDVGNGFWEIEIDRFHNWGKVQERQFDFLLKEFENPTISETELKRILGNGGNRAVFQIFFPVGTKNIVANQGESKTWGEYGRVLYQLELDELLVRENQNIIISFQLPTFSGDAELVLWNE